MLRTVSQSISNTQIFGDDGLNMSPRSTYLILEPCTISMLATPVLQT